MRITEQQIEEIAPWAIPPQKLNYEDDIDSEFNGLVKAINNTNWMCTLGGCAGHMDSTERLSYNEHFYLQLVVKKESFFNKFTDWGTMVVDEYPSTLEKHIEENNSRIIRDVRGKDTDWGEYLSGQYRAKTSLSLRGWGNDDLLTFTLENECHTVKEREMFIELCKIALSEVET